MPKLGESVTEGTIGKWLKQPGEKVNKYDLLVEVQTDKVNTEIPSPVAGTLKEVKVDEGQTVPIGTLLATFDTDGDAAAASPAAASPAAAQPSSAQPASAQPAPAQPAQAQPAQAQPQATPPQGAQPTTPASSSASTTPRSTSESVPSQPQRPSRAAPSMSSPPSQPSASAAGSTTATAERPDLSDVRATPAVRKLAAENGIDISQIEGTGLGGRVSKKDVEDYLASAQAAPAAQQPQTTEEPQAAGQPRAAEQPQARPAAASQVVSGGPGSIAARA